VTLRRVPAPPGDPFWEALLRRRPESELVLLPPERSGTQLVEADAAEMVDQELVEDIRQAVRTLVADILDRLGLSGRPSINDLDRLRAGRARGSVVAEVRRVVVAGGDRLPADGARPPDLLADRLRADGWDVVVRPGILTRVIATRAARGDLPGFTLVVGFASAGATDTDTGTGTDAEAGAGTGTGTDARAERVSVEAETSDLPLAQGRARALLRADRARRNPGGS
jgi:hypothetical protein